MAANLALFVLYTLCGLTVINTYSPISSSKHRTRTNRGSRYFQGLSNDEFDWLRLAIAPETGFPFQNNRPARRARSVDSTSSKSQIEDSPIIPMHYDLWMRPDIYSDDPEEFTLLGFLGINFNVTESVQQIQLQYGEQLIRDYQLSEEGNPQQINISRHVNPGRDFLVFDLDQGDQLLPGHRYTLSISFEGRYHEPTWETYGVFLNYYQDANGYTQWMCATCLQPSFAREVFPCLDEPQYKATFSFRISRRPWMIALSNTLKVSEHTSRDAWVTDHFETTIRLPTYLVAFTVFRSEDWARAMVDDFHHLVTTLWVPWYHFDEAQNVSEMVPGMIHYFQEYFDLRLPMRKMDIVWLPQFSAGGMENSGLIVMNLGLFVRGVQDERVYTRAMVVTHELVHQWLGNLVSPEGWEHVWLSEGLTTHFSWVGMEALHPNMEIGLRDMRWYSYIRAMQLDGYRELSRSVYQPTVTEGMESFNFLYVYIKGSAIVQIIEKILGEQQFRQFLRTFLVENMYQTATTESFLRALGKHSAGLIQAETFKPWLYDNGYPIIKVTKGETNITLDPVHFTNETLDETRPLDDLDSFEAPIPVMIDLKYTSGTRQSIQTVIRGRQVLSVNTEDLAWFIVNSNHLYYRVLYDESSWQLLISQLRDDPNVFSVETQQALVADTSMFYGASYVPVEMYLEIKGCVKAYLG